MIKNKQGDTEHIPRGR